MALRVKSTHLPPGSHARRQIEAAEADIAREAVGRTRITAAGRLEVEEAAIPGGPVSVFLPVETVSEMNRRDHFIVRHRRLKSHRDAAWLLCLPHPVPCVVTLTRVGGRSLDDDNLRSALKGVRDGVADRLGVDDADPRVEWRYAQARKSRKRGAQRGVRVEIKPAGS